MQRVTVTLDDDLMAELDAIIAERGYQNRSESDPRPCPRRH